MLIDNKFLRLKEIISKMGSVLIAFSGGVDSTFLLKAALLVLPEDKVLAITANSATYPREELICARKTAYGLEVRHKVIQTHELNDKRFLLNPAKRCYFCKSELFSRLKKEARKAGLNFVLDATNASDKKDFRPGAMAKNRFKIRSPLEEAGITKKEIRVLSRRLGLSSWDKPSLACLASRIPYGRKITPGLLKRIEQAESYLKRMGFKQVRVRDYDGFCRIEVDGQNIPRIMHKRNLVVEKLKGLGYNYITLDLEGYRTGSLNEVLRAGKE
ncbi:ATP-dependent sacrificial sulfur transferase LarE [bacterium]|nr:MAG: ATP-dependent sacrificial sulfur transferase LarE [bacterium]